MSKVPRIDHPIQKTGAMSPFLESRPIEWDGRMSISTIVTRSRLPCVISSYTLTRDQNLVRSEKMCGTIGCISRCGLILLRRTSHRGVENRSHSDRRPFLHRGMRIDAALLTKVLPKSVWLIQGATASYPFPPDTAMVAHCLCSVFDDFTFLYWHNLRLFKGPLSPSRAD